MAHDCTAANVRRRDCTANVRRHAPTCLPDGVHPLAINLNLHLALARRGAARQPDVANGGSGGGGGGGRGRR